MRGYQGIKYTLFICCYVFWVVSAVLIAVGVYAKIAKETALLLIIVGSVMFLITFLGCLGALRNATYLLKTFLGILAVVLFLQIAAGIVGYLFTDVFQCCGVEGYKDWSQNVYFQCSETNPSLEACGVPFSCCVRLQNQTVLNTMCGYGKQRGDERLARQRVFTVGCLEKIVWWAKNNLLLVGGLTCGLLVLEVVMIFLAAAQISWINKVQRNKKLNATRSKSQRKDSVWFPAFPNLDEE
ncbi:Tetraspanin-33 [Channa argus]|uniref:Tetraspanin n=1 Tax=Channa argus TaxID=215402 RepID=A0A6G1PK60_CHAAH|nr:Tetraspanin-33 [Channa argus]